MIGQFVFISSDNDDEGEADVWRVFDRCPYLGVTNIWHNVNKSNYFHFNRWEFKYSQANLLLSFFCSVQLTEKETERAWRERKGERVQW